MQPCQPGGGESQRDCDHNRKQRHSDDGARTEKNDVDETQRKRYHQDYYLKNPVRYQYYRLNCGRDARLKQLWGNQAGH